MAKLIIGVLLLFFLILAILLFLIVIFSVALLIFPKKGESERILKAEAGGDIERRVL
jgi:hypothetical protein